jgi:hypothetical protein
MNSEEFILNLCGILWPQTEIFWLDVKALQKFRGLFYSIFVESLSIEDRKIFRQYEGLSTKDFNVALTENFPIISEQLEIKAKRQGIFKKLQSKFFYLTTCLQNIKNQIKTRLATIPGGESYLDDEHDDDDNDFMITPAQLRNTSGNDTTSGNNNKNVISNEINNDSNNKIKENRQLWGTFKFANLEKHEDVEEFFEEFPDFVLVEYNELFDEEPFKFQFDFVGKDDNKNDAGGRDDDESKKRMVLENPQRSIRKLRGYLYLIAGGYNNSPPYTKLGCSSATEVNFFKRGSHYWIGSNPRYCFRYYVILSK